FYNVYDDLRTLEPGVPAGVPPVIPLTASNRLEGETYGIETGPRWQVCDWWLLQASYSFIQMQLHTKPGSRSKTAEAAEGQSPHHQAGLRSYINISPQWDFDAGVRYVGALSGIGIGSYTEADIRIAWRPKPGLEISVVGQNLIHAQHPEFRPSLIPTQAAEVERAVYGKITWHF
ncbi:MAG TPA: TonB-dependent receptor, partial [Roseimicrobium sp.]|nr:TonB-dependent receptor [Roseimicrobium sp.]